MTHLIEHESKFLLGASLREMHNNRIQNYYNILNFAIFGGFVIIVGLVLYNLKKAQLTPQEKAKKMYREQQYILSKIRETQQQHTERKQITNLPAFDKIHQYMQ